MTFWKRQNSGQNTSQGSQGLGPGPQQDLWADAVFFVSTVVGATQPWCLRRVNVTVHKLYLNIQDK